MTTSPFLYGMDLTNFCESFVGIYNKASILS